MRPELYATKRASIALWCPGQFAFHALILITAAAALTPGHSAELLSSPGNYDCSFAPSTQIAAGTNPFSVAVGDLNGDGVMDIAVANEGSDNVSILLATGAGTFAAATQVAVGSAPQSVVIDDVNGDGKLDLIVANAGDGSLTIGFGTGTGTFGSPGTLAVGNGPRGLAVADLNGDGKRDLVVANGADSVSVLRGTGAGAFAAAVAYAVAGNPISVAIDDFNVDGKPDLAVASENSATVSTLFGNGAGGFGTATPIPVGQKPRAVVSEDFNTDGKPDLAVANWDSANVSILLGSGAGAFHAAVNYPASALPTALALVDFDADDRLELVVANETSLPNIVTVLRGLDGGIFAAPTTVPVGGIRPRGVAAGDFNADGIPDLAVANYTSNDVSILLGDCAPVMNIAPNANVDQSGSYELRKSPVWFDRTVASAYTHVVSHTDLNRDGRTDLVRASITAGQTTPVQMLMQTAGGSFVDQTPAVLTTDQPGMVYPRKGLSGDYNGDGWPDVLILGTGEDVVPFQGEFNQLFLSNGDGTLRYSAALEDSVGYHHGGASADIDGNGTIDVLTVNAGCQGTQCGLGVASAYFLINDGDGTFTRNTSRLPAELQGGAAIYTIELIDVDRDGFIDVISAGNEFTEGVTPATIYWGSSSGLYRAAAKTVLPKPAGNGGVLDFAAEDIDGDGDRDVIISRFPDNFATNGRYFQILRQASPRLFVDETASRISMNTNLEAFDFFRVQDINGDGWLDIFIDDKRFASIGEYAWTNNGQGVFAPYFGVVKPEVVPPQPAFQINAGLNDAWYDPLTDGQGFFITVFPDSGVVFLSWFTYDTTLPPDDATAALGDPGHRWLTAQGVYAGNQSVMDITITSGGIFDTMADVSRTDDGTIILTFTDCTSGTVEYDIPSINQQGVVPIQRIVNDNVDLCTDLNSQAAVQTGGGLEDMAPSAVDPEMNAGLNDAWFNPLTDGQGLFITVFPDISTVFLAWFTFDTDPPPDGATANLGDPGHRWLTAQGVFTGNESVMDLTITSGGLFDTSAEVERTDPPGSDGTLTLTFESCESGTVAYDIPSISMAGIVPIQRIVGDNAPLCETLSSQ